MIMERKKKRMLYKQVLAIRTDLGMSPGKAIAQAAHVSVLAALKAKESDPDNFKAWLDEGYMKIACKVRSLEELKALEKAANESGLPHAVVVDFGRTELEPGSMTAIAIGPALATDVNPVTGKLKLM
jgi:PTH2 family peptidyl-tRNA hydrolase